VVGKGDFRRSKSEAEERLARTAKSMDMIDFVTDHYVCLHCGEASSLTRGEAGQLYLPLKCIKCGMLYGQKFQFCVPDGIISSREKPTLSGIVFVNEDAVHGQHKVADRDRRQIELLRNKGYEIFVLSDGEIYSMTLSTMRVWLYGAAESLRKRFLTQALYREEKEYPCLRDK
jgi:hypothetical protein